MEENNIVPIEGDQVVAIAESAERRIEAMRKIKGLALKLTNPGDWVDQGGRPYLQVSGAEKIARLFGISWRIDEPTVEYDDGGHFTYTYRGTFTLGTASIEAIGARSSRDPFFSRRGGEDIPPNAIDRGDVKKSAYTNLLGNGIARLLGIRNLTWEDLAEAGLHAGSRVDYRKTPRQEVPTNNTATTNTNTTNTTIAAHVSDVRRRTGSKDGKTWTVYIIRAEGTEYRTFSESIAQAAKEAMEAGLEVELTYKEGRFGRDIVTLKKIEPDVPDLPDREPGQEG